MSYEPVPARTSPLGVLGGLVALAAVVVALLIGAAICLAVWDPHAHNQIVTWVRHAGRWLAQPFDGIFTYRDATDRLIADWGLAAAVYLLGGLILGGLLRRMGLPRRPVGTRRRVAA